MCCNVLVIPAFERWNSWDSLTSQPSQIGKFQTSVRPHLKTKPNKKTKKIEDRV